MYLIVFNGTIILRTTTVVLKESPAWLQLGPLFLFCLPNMSSVGLLHVLLGVLVQVVLEEVDVCCLLHIGW